MHKIPWPYRDGKYKWARITDKNSEEKKIEERVCLRGGLLYCQFLLASGVIRGERFFRAWIRAAARSNYQIIDGVCAGCSRAPAAIVFR